MEPTKLSNGKKKKHRNISLCDGRVFGENGKKGTTKMLMYAAIDLSLTSPAVAIYDCTLQSWSFLAFEQRSADRWATSDSRVHMAPRIPTTKMASDVERYTHIIRHLVAFLPQDSSTACPIILEGYAFNTRRAGSSFKLHELGGILKYQLHARGFVVHIVPPTQWKKRTVGCKASKVDTVEFVRGIIDLQSVFQCTGAPNPIQDIADAIAMVVSLYPSVRPQVLNT